MAGSKAMSTTSDADASALKARFECYQLGINLESPGFCYAVISQLHEKVDKGALGCGDLSTELVKYAYDYTKRVDDPLREFCISALCEGKGVGQVLDDKRVKALQVVGGAVTNDLSEKLRGMAGIAKVKGSEKTRNVGRGENGKKKGKEGWFGGWMGKA